jgi:hypothetical protein
LPGSTVEPSTVRPLEDPATTGRRSEAARLLDEYDIEGMGE